MAIKHIINKLSVQRHNKKNPEQPLSHLKKTKFSIEDLFSKCEHVSKKLRIC